MPSLKSPKMRTKIRIKWMRTPANGNWGMAIPEKKTIYLEERMDDRTMMDVAMHEVAHVMFPMLDEEAVNEFGIVAADVLTRIGFKREHE